LDCVAKKGAREGRQDRLGTIEAGKLADIIAIPGNPLEDISLLEQTSFVMLGGKIIKSPDQANPPN
jgi:imidazolonepropionase-like amidohydrolase